MIAREKLEKLRAKNFFGFRAPFLTKLGPRYYGDGCTGP
jgi:hypothetical protein